MFPSHESCSTKCVREPRVLFRGSLTPYFGNVLDDSSLRLEMIRLTLELSGESRDPLAVAMFA